MAVAASDETLVERHTRLRQIVCGRELLDDQSETSIGLSELVDALFVLYNECSKDSFKRNKYAAGFVKKCECSPFVRLCSTAPCTRVARFRPTKYGRFLSISLSMLTCQDPPIEPCSHTVLYLYN